MTRLLISVEGKSERKFVDQILKPHLSNFGVYVGKPQDMRGNISIDRVSRKLNSLVDNYDFVTTLYDFYGFGKRGLEDDETKETLEKKIKESIKSNQQHKIIPYIQMYEFEALLFSDAEIMAKNLNVSQNWIDNRRLNNKRLANV
jgi:hypothetical protein